MEVTDARQCQVHQFIEEFIHPFAAQGNFAAEVHAFTDFESCDGFLGFRDDRFLTGNDGHIIDSSVQGFGVGNSFANGHVDNNFGNLRNLHYVFIIVFFLQAFYDFGKVFVF